MPKIRTNPPRRKPLPPAPPPAAGTPHCALIAYLDGRREIRLHAINAEQEQRLSAIRRTLTRLLALLDSMEAAPWLN